MHFSLKAQQARQKAGYWDPDDEKVKEGEKELLRESAKWCGELLNRFKAAFWA